MAKEVLPGETPVLLRLKGQMMCLSSSSAYVWLYAALNA